MASPTHKTSKPATEHRKISGGEIKNFSHFDMTWHTKNVSRNFYSALKLLPKQASFHLISEFMPSRSLSQGISIPGHIAHQNNKL